MNNPSYGPQGHTPQNHTKEYQKQGLQNPRPHTGGSNPQRQEKGYKKLIAWQKSDELALQIYQSSEAFPRDETYGVRSQIRRAALSVPTNLVEGNGRQSRKEFKHYINIALGSLSEVEYLLDFSLKLGYFSEPQHKNLCSLRDSVGGLLWRLYKSIAD